jgi:hypothetical protein
MAMETSLACLSADAALFAVSFFSLSARFVMPALHIRRPRHVFHTRRPLFWRPRLSHLWRAVIVILFGGMVVEEKRRSCNCGGIWRVK